MGCEKRRERLLEARAEALLAKHGGYLLAVGVVVFHQHEPPACFDGNGLHARHGFEGFFEVGREVGAKFVNVDAVSVHRVGKFTDAAGGRVSDAVARTETGSGLSGGGEISGDTRRES